MATLLDDSPLDPTPEACVSCLYLKEFSVKGKIFWFTFLLPHFIHCYLIPQNAILQQPSAMHSYVFHRCVAAHALHHTPKHLKKYACIRASIHRYVQTRCIIHCGLIISVLFTHRWLHKCLITKVSVYLFWDCLISLLSPVLSIWMKLLYQHGPLGMNALLPHIWPKIQALGLLVRPLWPVCDL